MDGTGLKRAKKKWLILTKEKKTQEARLVPGEQPKTRKPRGTQGCGLWPEKGAVGGDTDAADLMEKKKKKARAERRNV